jgi:hypothetical protein
MIRHGSQHAWDTKMTETTLERSGVQTHPDPSPEQIRTQLERILDSRGFKRSPRLQRFLRYAVEITLSGDEDRLKEYTLGLEVFDRDADFDPRLDSIVRVEAFRARKKLARYYATDGSDDHIVIYLTKGDYRARFTFASIGREDDQCAGIFDERSIRFWESTGPSGETEWVERGSGDDQGNPGFFESIHFEDRAKVKHAISESFRTGMDLSLNFRISIGSGRVQYIHAHGMILTDEDGRAERMLGICISFL